VRGPTHFLISEARAALEGAPVLGLCLRHLLHQAVHISLSLHNNVRQVIISNIVTLFVIVILLMTMIMMIQMMMTMMQAMIMLIAIMMITTTIMITITITMTINIKINNTHAANALQLCMS